MNWTKEKIRDRLIRYDDLVPCKNAFVDTRTPGSDQKENFTLIGPGVSENPNQHLHIKEPHGFNIGGARQPVGCLNSQHSHLTAEVFVVHAGKWRFSFGVNANDGSVELSEGDIISIPTNMFRGFENIGSEIGFLFAILGKDNPGKVIWSPKVFELAKKYGLALLKGGRLIDTTAGEKVPAGAELEEPPSQEELARLKTPDLEKLNNCVAYFKDLKPNFDSPLTNQGVEESGIIVPKKTNDGFTEGEIKPWWQHGFNLRKLKINPKGETKWHSRFEAEVIFVQEGKLSFFWREDGNEESLTLEKGDTLTVPIGLERRFVNENSSINENFIVRGGDTPLAPNLK